MKYAIIIFTILTFTSCKKEYTCQCVDKDGHEVYSLTYKVTKNDRATIESDCKGEVTALTVQNPTVSPFTCSLN